MRKSVPNREKKNVTLESLAHTRCCCAFSAAVISQSVAPKLLQHLSAARASTSTSTSTSMQKTSPSRRRRAASPAKQATLTKKKTAPPEVKPEQKASPLITVVLPLLIMIPAPIYLLTISYITGSLEEPTFAELFSRIQERGLAAVALNVFEATLPTLQAAKILGIFCYLALLLYWWPGPTLYGPISSQGTTPDYVDNGIAHWVMFAGTFIAASDCFGYGFGCFSLSILFTHFQPMIGLLNYFGICFVVFLYFKGIYFPSGPDSGRSDAMDRMESDRAWLDAWDGSVE